jgi:hypothetical protein
MRLCWTVGAGPILRRATVAIALVVGTAACGAAAQTASPVTTTEPTPSATTTPGGSMSDDDEVQAALDPLWPAFDEATYETGDFSALTEGQRAVAFAWVLSGLVDNGGFASWIESIGHRTPDAKAALAYLGASEYVPLLDEAMRLYPTFAGTDEVDRLSASDHWTSADEARLDALDESFYALSARRDLVGHYASAYVAAHPAEFPR